MNFENIAKEAFQVLRSYDFDVVLFDEQGAQIYEPQDARRFFAKPDNLMLAILDDGENSRIQLYLSKTTDVTALQGMIDTLRTMGTKYNMVFHVKEKDKTLSPKDFATGSSVFEQKRTYMNIVEGMYGTSRSSYLKLENARMIVRHSARINENALGARGRNVEAIFIENSLGERMRFPTTNLAPARAMTHHVDNGGSWADAVGEQIGRMASDFANLSAAHRHVGVCGGELTEEAHAIRAKVREGALGLRQTFEGLCRKTRYGEICEALAATAAAPLTEGEDDPLAESVATLANLLNTEQVSLSESVLRSVAALLEAEGGAERADDAQKRRVGRPRIHPVADPNAPKGKPGRKKKDPDAEGANPNFVTGDKDPDYAVTWIMPGVLGQPQGFRIGTEAWKALLNGEIDLYKTPEIETRGEYRSNTSARVELGNKEFLSPGRVASAPSFTDPVTKWCYYVQALGEACRDPGLGTLLTMIATEYPQRKNTEDALKMKRVATAALRAAKLDPAEGEGAVAKTAEVREFVEWLAGFKAESLLAERHEFEFGDSDPTAPTDHLDARASHLVDGFDPEAFLHSAEAEHYLFDEVARLSPEEMILSKDEILSDLARYLENRANDDEEFTGITMADEAVQVYPQVADALTAAGYVIEGDDTLDEGEDCPDDACTLSQEDVLLPKGQEETLFSEVTRGEPGRGSSDQDSIHRLLTLSGVHR